MAIVKNEFGDMNIDSALMDGERNVQGVKEFQNGCLCCTMTGPMQEALFELYEKFRPDRIIIETSGSAFPAPIAIHLRRLEQDGHPFKLDSIITVIDCLSFGGYEDASHTAKIQAKFTDCIIMNKWESLTERQYEDVLDHVLTLNDDTLIVKSIQRTIDPHLIFNLDTGLYNDASGDNPGDSSLSREDERHHDEIDVLQLYAANEVPMTVQQLEDCLRQVQTDDIIRIKGRLRIAEGAKMILINWAFRRWDLTEKSQIEMAGPALQVVIMLRQGCAPVWRERLVSLFKADKELTTCTTHR